MRCEQVCTSGQAQRVLRVGAVHIAIREVQDKSAVARRGGGADNACVLCTAAGASDNQKVCGAPPLMALRARAGCETAAVDLADI